MSKLQVFGLTFVTTCVVCALVVASASAETLLAEWLINGVGVAAPTGYTDPGEFVFGQKSVQKVKCSFITMGALDQNGGGEVKEILSLSGVLINLAAQLLTCEGTVGCAKEADIEVAPENLPWKILA
jgi:hypothetical protein